MERKKTLYEITGDLKALSNLLNSLVDEEGDPREPTDAEFETMKEWFQNSEDEFKAKFDNYCKFIKNLQIEAEIAKGEKDAHKKEINRLTRRSTAFENRAKSVKNLLWFNMERLELAEDGFKTTLFSAKEQKTQKSVNALTSFDWHKIPEEFLKTPELDSNAIKQALKDGVLIQKEGSENYGKVFFKDGTQLEGVAVTQGKALVIR